MHIVLYAVADSDILTGDILLTLFLYFFSFSVHSLLVNMILNKEYRNRNLFAVNFAGFTAIAIVVFLSATQPFYLSEVIGVDAVNVGTVIGTLGFLDEIVSICLAIFLGTLNDKINCWAWWSWKIPSGSRVIVFFGFVIIAMSFLAYGTLSKHVFPDLWLSRGLFALGFTATMSMVTVMLHEANNSDFEWMNLAFWRKTPLSRDYENLDTNNSDEGVSKRKNGRLSALLGVSTGLGAVFAVSVLLPLPVKLGTWNPGLSPGQGLQKAYVILSFGSLLGGLVVFFFAYDALKHRRLVATEAEEEPRKLYIQLLKEGFNASKENRIIQLAYVSGFVARSTAVCNSVFIPVLVYKFYYASGACSNGNDINGPPAKDSCYDGYVFLAILTGVALTVLLISSPMWGILVDSRKLGPAFLLVASSMSGVIGCFGLCLAGHFAKSAPTEGQQLYDPRNALCFILVSFIGLSQVGLIISGMSLISSIGKSPLDGNHHVIGSVLGVYTFCGGLGVLLITKFGGLWSDKWVFGPFFILGLLDIILLIAAARSKGSFGEY